MSTRMRLLGGVVAVLMMASTQRVSGEAMRYVYVGAESPADVRQEYRVEMLRAALERTRGEYGDYVLEQAAEPMLQRRQVEELREKSGRVTVMYRSDSPEMARDLLPVRVPVDRGLTGYRVLLIRQGDRERFAAVRTVEELRKFTYGVELGWLDKAVLRADGFQVVAGTDYEGLFEMLANGRFDAFPRAVHEVVAEYEARRERLPGLAVEGSLVVHYPLPMYFWFAKSEEGERLAARVKEGLTGMLKDGTFERIFFKHYGPTIAALGMEERRVFRLKNPLLDETAPVDDHRLWYDPTRDKVPAEAREATTRPPR